MAEMSERGSASVVVIGTAVAAMVGGGLLWLHNQHEAVQETYDYTIQCLDGYHIDPHVLPPKKGAMGARVLRFVCINTASTTDAPYMAPTDIWRSNDSKHSAYGSGDPSFGSLWQATIRISRSSSPTARGGKPQLVLDPDKNNPFPHTPVVEISPLEGFSEYHRLAVTSVEIAPAPAPETKTTGQ